MLPRLAMLTGAVVVAALAAELILPYVGPNPGTLQPIIHHFDESERYVLLPDIEIEFSGMFEQISPPVLWRVNAQRVRTDEPVAPADGRYRIATYGDSEAFGWSVATKDTLQRRMEDIDERVQALNFGIPGYNAENVADLIEPHRRPHGSLVDRLPDCRLRAPPRPRGAAPGSRLPRVVYRIWSAAARGLTCAGEPTATAAIASARKYGVTLVGLSLVESGVAGNSRADSDRAEGPGSRAYGAGHPP